MVLPASPADAAPPAAPWLDRLTGIFRLGQGRGVLVLVRGGLERLGELVRCVVGLAPDASVLLRADEIASLPPGSTAVLCLRREDFDWLNVGRPAVLGHRIVLFGDAETALAMERQAVDFCDWISHRIDAPSGPPAFAVRALRNAACHRVPAIVWEGGEVEPVFAEALPGRRLERVSAAQPYADLVTALRPKARTWVLVTDLDAEFRVCRVRWATAEARRYGRTILESPAARVVDLPSVRATPLATELAAAKLKEAGVERAARLAALLDLEPRAIEQADSMARRGLRDKEIEDSVLHSTPARGPRHPEGRSLPAWPERIEFAVRNGDHEVALYWAAAWRAAEPKNARSLSTLAYVRLRQGDLDGVSSLLADANELAGSHQDIETEFEIRRAEGLFHANQNRPAKALRVLGEAIRLLDKAHRSDAEAAELYSAHVRALVSLGRIKEAERGLRDWPQRTRTSDSDGARGAAAAAVKLAQGDATSAIQILRRILNDSRWARLSSHDPLVQMLAEALIVRKDFQEAERVTREAARRAEEQGRDGDLLWHEHARALYGLGRFGEAELELKSLLARRTPGLDALATRHELALCLHAQGKLDEAEAVIDEAIKELSRSPSRGSALNLGILYQKALLQRARGNYAESALLLEQIIRQEERTVGRAHPVLVRPLTELGKSLIERQEVSAAQPYLRRAQRIAEGARDDMGLAEALGLLAVAEHMQHLPQAVHTARRALDAWRRAGREPLSVLQADIEAIAAARS